MSLNLNKTSWRRVRFGEVVRNVTNTTRVPESLGINRVVAMEHMDPSELKIERWGDVADGTSFTRVVTPGQTLFGKRRAYQRKVAYAEFDAICSSDIYTFEAIEGELVPALLPFLVQSEGFFDHALGTSAGSLSPRTNWRDLADFEFALPPVSEQERFAELLWAVERHRRSLATLVTALEHTLQPFIRSFTKNFPRLPLADSAHMYQPRTISAADLVEDGAYVVYGANGPMGRYTAFNHSHDEIAVACRGFTSGAVNWTKGPSWITGNSMVIQPTEGVSKRYLYWVLLLDADLASAITGTTLRQITKKSIESVVVPIPDRNQMDQVTSELELLSDRLHQVQNGERALNTLRASLINDIFGDK
ncbi:restriction endonuclease subunit S [Corynebacterium auriscanis]|uniref:restriction endonuclease subunit S n=1 Tax=Corynebacterium auriscanis TaxID=99807 RepID=UPI003CF77A1C